MRPGSGKLDAFAEAIANGADVVAAGASVGYTATVAHAMFQKMRRKLGWQAQ